MPCSDDSWHDLLVAFNTHTTEVIRIPRDALADVVECEGKPPPANLIARPPRAGSTTVEVNRAALFAYLQQHPGVCHAP